jgi:hypothetical protein
MISIQMLLDLNSMSVEEAIGHLHAVEERKKKPTGGAKERRLLLSEEEWMVHLKVWEGESSRGRGRGQGRRGGHAGGGGGRGSQTKS